MVLTEKLLSTVGFDDDTASVSDAEQTPPVHEVDAFVLLTFAGGLMEATLFTWVWA
jgi:hypothetical protein